MQREQKSFAINTTTNIIITITITTTTTTFAHQRNPQHSIMQLVHNNNSIRPQYDLQQRVGVWGLWIGV